MLPFRNDERDLRKANPPQHSVKPATKIRGGKIFHSRVAAEMKSIFS